MQYDTSKTHHNSLTVKPPASLDPMDDPNNPVPMMRLICASQGKSWTRAIGEGDQRAQAGQRISMNDAEWRCVGSEERPGGWVILVEPPLSVRLLGLLGSRGRAG